MLPQSAFWQSINRLDAEGLRTLLAAGENPNQHGDPGDDPPLSAIMWTLRDSEFGRLEFDGRVFPSVAAVRAACTDCLRVLLQAGADPNLIFDEDTSPMWHACLFREPAFFELLVRHGGNPNQVLDSGETLYDSTDFDYRYDTFDLHPKLKPTDADKADEDHWLAYLYCAAERENATPPTFLTLMRSLGARSARELRDLSRDSTVSQPIDGPNPCRPPRD